MSQNARQYENFEDQPEQYPRGIPVGLPQQVPHQQPNQHYAHNPYQTSQQHRNVNQTPGHQMPPNFPNQPVMMDNQIQAQPQQQYFSHSCHSFNTKMCNFSMQLNCPCCKNTVQSVMNPQSGNTTFIWAVTLCCVAGNCCCLPYMFNECLDKAHYCPCCGYQILRKHAKCLEFANI